jgi:trk system potassium uptake protein TrkH
VIIAAATICLNMTEGGDLPHPAVRGLSLKILFEVISAFGTVGLTMGLTPKLTAAGKLVIIVLMFAGRLGPILIVAAIQSLQKQINYRWPESGMLIG